MESFFAKEKEVSLATEEVVEEEPPPRSHPTHKIGKKHPIMYKKRFIMFKFTIFICLYQKFVVLLQSERLIPLIFMLFEAQIHDFLAWLPWVRIRREQSALRAIIEQRRRMLSPEEVKADSEAIISQIEQMSVFRDAQTVMIYYPIHNEVDLRPLLAKYEGQKTFLFPVTHRHSMEVRPYDGEDMMMKGRLGVPEPQTPTYKGHIDLILVPGVVFDKHRHRIGRGGGYYDKFLAKQLTAKTIGICYAFQLKRHDIPHLATDKRMDRVVTPQQTIG